MNNIWIDENTEVLTCDGWERISNIYDTSVCVVNPNSNEVLFKNVLTPTLKNDESINIYNYVSDQFDLLVTSDSLLYVLETPYDEIINGRIHNFKSIEANKVTEKFHYYKIPTYFNNGGIEPSEESPEFNKQATKLFAMFVQFGIDMENGLVMSVNNRSFLNTIQKICSELNSIHCNTYINDNGTYMVKIPSTILNEFVIRGCDNILLWKNEYLQLFYSMFVDETTCNNLVSRTITRSFYKNLIDSLQGIMVMLGKFSWYTCSNNNSSGNLYTLYSKNPCCVYDLFGYKNIINNNIPMYSIDVDDCCLIIRRNGKVSICGGDVDRI